MGLNNHHHVEWIAIGTLDKIQEGKNKKTAINNSQTRTEKVKAQAEYKQLKRSIRYDKQKYVEDLATTVKKASREGNMKQLDDTTKKLIGKYSKPQRSVKDKESKTITKIQEQMNRWAEHFKELLNKPTPLKPLNIEAAHTTSYRWQPTNDRRIRMAIRQIRIGKAAEPDNIPTEALKLDIKEIANMLHNLFGKIWDEEQVPIDWKEGYHQDTKERRSEHM
ncbi:unnamed protein product [Schistosoma mattheei]|uniref:Uncharacterized protein n=1 Tax=Schistosoma mattheei TaxID=31246 RepID=A0A183PR11_9TREM|nr:unnamed protein product [Schistosoma mattheei]